MFSPVSFTLRTHSFFPSFSWLLNSDVLSKHRKARTLEGYQLFRIQRASEREREGERQRDYAAIETAENGGEYLHGDAISAWVTMNPAYSA